MKKNILVIEDMTGVRNIIIDALYIQGYNTIAAANGAEAMEILNKDFNKIDLIISDYNMPKMNGMELLTNVRASSNPNISKKPFIFLTSEKCVEKMKMAKSQGVNSWIVKPYNYKAFLAEIKYALDER